MDNLDRELEDWKSNINLVAFALSYGYQLDLQYSSKHSRVLRRPTDDDKIVVATSEDGHGIYFSVRDSTDNGSIIDFVQKRERKNLGQVRQHLRQWQNSFPYCPSCADIDKPLPSCADHQRVVLELVSMADAQTDSGYLMENRKISSAILADARFRGVIKIDERENAIFPHRNRTGICGYEIKNAGFTGFSSGGSKGLWLSHQITQASTIVLVESAIDALSHAQLKPGNAGYASFGGSLSTEQHELIRGLIVKATARSARVVVATDNDEAGERYFTTIVELASPIVIERERPTAKDWNDELRGSV